VREGGKKNNRLSLDDDSHSRQREGVTVLVCISETHYGASRSLSSTRFFRPTRDFRAQPYTNGQKYLLAQNFCGLM
jgi:hypothetical protein